MVWLMRWLRVVFTVVALNVFVLLSALFAFVWIWLVPVAFLAQVAWFVYNGLFKVPEDPAHVGVLVFFGRRLEIVLKEGWKFIPLRPFVFNIILINVVKKNFDMPPQEVRTPDNATISVKPSATWKPGIKGSPKSFLNYLNSGGEEGIQKILLDVVEDRTKTWAGSNREGPSTWMEAQTLRDDAHEVLVKALLRGALAEVDDPIPTSTWMRFFERPQSEPTAYDCAVRPNETGTGNVQWAEKDDAGKWNWNGLRAIFNSYPGEKQTILKDRIKRRRDAVREVREGKGEFGEESLGITIIRFSIGDIKVVGKVAEAADLQEKEKREAAADATEIANVSKRIGELCQDHPNMSLQEAIRLVQTERGKISQSVIELLGAKTGLGQDLLGALGFQKIPSAPVAPAPGQGNQGQQGGGQRKKKKRDPGEMTDKDANAYLDSFLRGEEEDEEDEDEAKK